MTCADVVFLASPLTFDPSVVDLFLALSSGARLLVVPAVLKKIPRRLCQLLFRRHKTTLMQVIPIRTVAFKCSLVFFTPHHPQTHTHTRYW